MRSCSPRQCDLDHDHSGLRAGSGRASPRPLPLRAAPAQRAPGGSQAPRVVARTTSAGKPPVLTFRSRGEPLAEGASRREQGAACLNVAKRSEFGAAGARCPEQGSRATFGCLPWLLSRASKKARFDRQRARRAGEWAHGRSPRAKPPETPRAGQGQGQSCSAGGMPQARKHRSPDPWPATTAQDAGGHHATHRRWGHGQPSLCRERGVVAGQRMPEHRLS